MRVRDTLTADMLDSILTLYAGEWWTRSRTRADAWAALCASDLVLTV